MTKKPQSAIVNLTSIQTKKRPTKHQGNRSKAKGAILTVHHKPDAPATAGSDERRMMLKWCAMKWKIAGYSLREIAVKIKEEFELVKAPTYEDVDDWLDDAYAAAVTDRQINADREVATIFLRGEELIKNLIPIALGKVIIRRVRIKDGQEFEILSECDVNSMLQSTAEIRKLMDQRAKVLKIGRVGLPEGGAEGGSITGHNLTILVEKTVTNNIQFPGQLPKAPVTLILESGDPHVDALDAAGIVEEHKPGVI